MTQKHDREWVRLLTLLYVVFLTSFNEYSNVPSLGFSGSITVVIIIILICFEQGLKVEALVG